MNPFELLARQVQAVALFGLLMGQLLGLALALFITIKEDSHA